jgi:hypothetical protein
MMSHEQVTYSLIASVLHELNVQSTCFIAQEDANLMYGSSKIITLDSNDVAAIITTRTARRALRIYTEHDFINSLETGNPYSTNDVLL